MDEYETEVAYFEVEQYSYYIATRIKGESMEPIYQDGKVSLTRASGFDYDGAVYTLSWNDSVYIKKGQMLSICPKNKKAITKLYSIYM